LANPDLLDPIWHKLCVNGDCASLRLGIDYKLLTVY
jgi:hypothetical protein